MARNPDHSIDQPIPEELYAELSRRTRVNTDVTVYSDGAMGVQSPTRAGWKYTSAGSSDKINWYFYVAPNQVNYTLSQFQGMYALVHQHKANSVFYFTVYTIPQLDGNDAGGFYRSRINYNDETQFTTLLPSTRIVYTAGVDADVNFDQLNPELGHYGLAVDPLTTEGPQEGDEVILGLVVQTNSIAAAGDVETTFETVGYKIGDLWGISSLLALSEETSDITLPMDNVGADPGNVSFTFNKSGNTVTMQWPTMTTTDNGSITVNDTTNMADFLPTAAQIGLITGDDAGTTVAAIVDIDATSVTFSFLSAGAMVTGDKIYGGSFTYNLLN
jgi:hypothetical protein